MINIILAANKELDINNKINFIIFWIPIKCVVYKQISTNCDIIVSLNAYIVIPRNVISLVKSGYDVTVS